MKKLIVPLLLFLGACAPSHIVKPLQKGDKVVSVNAGGPLIGFGKSTIPVPLSAVTFGYGFTDKSTFFGSLHTTSLLFGVIQTEVGLVQGITEQKKYWPGISTSWVFNMAFDKWEWNYRCWPQIDVNAYWNYGVKQHLVYAGISNWFETRPYRNFDQKQQHVWLFNPQVGNIWMHNKWSYGLELNGWYLILQDCLM